MVNDHIKNGIDQHKVQRDEDAKTIKMAKREISLAKKTYTESNKSAGFMPKVYDVAIECIEKMHSIDEPGYNMNIILGLISSMIDRLPLTLIDNLGKDWVKVPHVRNTYSNKRYESLLKIIINAENTIYSDTLRVEVIDTNEYVDENGNEGNIFEPATWLIDSLYPITFPYHPQTIKVFVDRASSDSNMFIVKGVVTHEGELVMGHNGEYEFNTDTREVKLITDKLHELKKVVTILCVPKTSIKEDIVDSVYHKLTNDYMYPMCLPKYMEDDDIDYHPTLAWTNFLEQSTDMYKQLIQMSDVLYVINDKHREYFINSLVLYAERLNKKVIYHKEDDDNG